MLKSAYLYKLPKQITNNERNLQTQFALLHGLEINKCFTEYKNGNARFKETLIHLRDVRCNESVKEHVTLADDF
jgi:hypothetical protein